LIAMNHAWVDKNCASHAVLSNVSNHLSRPLP
jgi:hypothetical protein